MHAAAYAYIQARTADLSDDHRVVVEIGGRNLNGTVRDLFPRAESYTAIDLLDGPGVDVVANGATYTPDRLVDVVVCCEVLEHTAEAYLIVEHAYDILRPGGVLLITAAGEGRPPHSAIDGGALKADEFYANVSEHELYQWLWQFRPRVAITVNPETHDIYAVARR